MIINIGLLVHHKINLQNSVDLAAYYGAMKQAEMLNAVAHTNYQIRQSWKLLAWRYRQLGTAGAMSAAHPYNKLNNNIIDDIEGIYDQYPGFYQNPPFCITYSPFKPMPPDENTCKNVYESVQVIPLPKPPDVVAGFLGFVTAIREATKAVLASIEKRCQQMGVFNYIQLARFVAAYNMDQAERKLLIKHLATGMSEREDDFIDLDGESVRQGVEKTLNNNLTEPNRAGIKFQFFNSLGTAECGAMGVSSNDPPKWLSEVKIFPTYLYTDTKCSQEKVEPHPVHLMSSPTYGNLPQFRQYVDFLKTFAGVAPAPFNSSLGYEKNPWCMAYVGVSATARPKIPFSPLGSVELKAVAYAKPFGGKIGPWYANRFPKTQTGPLGQSTGTRLDELAPPRANDPSQLGDKLKDPSMVANFSRFPGDPFGMKSRRVLAQYGRAIYDIGKVKNARNIDRPSNSSGAEPSFEHWQDLAQEFKVTKHGDILAWDDAGRENNLMRQLEITAIAPDMFDISYYSIENNFYDNYFKKIRDGYLKNRPGFDQVLRPDLGARLQDKTLEKFSVKDQMEVVKKLAAQGSAAVVDIKDKLSYISIDPSQTLTSWVGTSLIDFNLDESKFGKCIQEVENKDMAENPAPSNCLFGGRTGYSVKIISGDYLRMALPLGGENVPADTIFNPPPSGF